MGRDALGRPAPHGLDAHGYGACVVCGRQTRRTAIAVYGALARSGLPRGYAHMTCLDRARREAQARLLAEEDK